MSAISTLRKRIAEDQAKLEAETNKLQAERAQLVKRLAEIDAELGSSEPRPVRPRAKDVGQRVLAFITANPGSTIKQVQEGLPDIPANTVENKIRELLGKATVVRDDSTPRKHRVAPAAPAPTTKPAAANGHRPSG